MKKRTKKKFLGIFIILLILGMTFGGVVSAVYVLFASAQEQARQQKEYDELIERMTAQQNNRPLNSSSSAGLDLSSLGDLSESDLALIESSGLNIPGLETADSQAQGLEASAPEQTIAPETETIDFSTLPFDLSSD